MKHTKLIAETDMEFRAEVFDVTNTPAFWPAEWKLRIGSVWEHFDHGGGSEGDAVCASLEQAE